MIAKRITRVMLTRSTEPTPGDHTSHPGDELWRFEYTRLSSAGKPETLRQSHYTEVAARGHVANLLEQRPDGASVADIYSESV